jgi:uncharacterized integral membrane protein
MTQPERSNAVEETRFRRGVRHGHRGGMYVAVAIVIAAVVYLILLIVANSKPVHVHYVFGTARTRLIWLVIISGLIGWVSGIATSYLIRRRTRRPR